MKVPKYRAIAREILNGIERGETAYGSRLPSEAAMARQYGVSLGTIQKALGVLSERGLVDRRHGSGTYVAAASGADRGNTTPVEEVKYFRFEPPDGGAVSSTKSRIISVDATSKHGPWSDFLGQGQTFTRISRVVRIDDCYEFFSRIFVSTRIARQLTRIPLDALHGTSFRRFFHQEHGIVTTHEEHAIRSAIMPTQVAELTGTAQGAIGMEWWIRIYNFSDTPVIFQQNFLPPTDYRLLF
ncbi:hypothetical protein LNKW23_43850 [Paralimibaculum aggregatum]|uniref:HTH gntR-type domain-containing protein n=1 Tax=Paralimibaculum aggregatum TaxID=3036245 RepID=A0ABQ6LSX1_9RHOB|nr:GntR family transcriptional regulator [Limibaculum sp. NKW23]GMG85169.1 hypothetical protein LNKW23_43850 [Limibaculum sp. NKW23]